MRSSALATAITVLLVGLATAPDAAVVGPQHAEATMEIAMGPVSAPRKPGGTGGAAQSEKSTAPCASDSCRTGYARAKRRHHS